MDHTASITKLTILGELLLVFVQLVGNGAPKKVLDAHCDLDIVIVIYT